MRELNSAVVIVLGARSVARRPTRATRLISTPPAHSKQRTHSTRERTDQRGRCRQ